MAREVSMSKVKKSRVMGVRGEAGTVRWHVWAMRLLMAAGIVVAGYLLWAYTFDEAIVCAGSSGCDLVKASRYSYIRGVLPLPLLGLFAYVTLLALSLLGERLLPALLRGYLPVMIFGIAFAGFLYSAYLTYLEFFVIYAVCKWCMSSAFIMTGLFALSFVDLKRFVDDEEVPEVV